ncbi:MAG TPA: hypothetical protein VF040_20235 [Ktedonobacterales bacterium]
MLTPSQGRRARLHVPEGFSLRLILLLQPGVDRRAGTDIMGFVGAFTGAAGRPRQGPGPPGAVRQSLLLR